MEKLNKYGDEFNQFFMESSTAWGMNHWNSSKQFTIGNYEIKLIPYIIITLCD